MLILGSSSAKKPEPVRPPQFEFTPPSIAAPNSANVTFALVDAGYSETEPWTMVAPFSSFSKSLSSDFQEILAARGFTVRGPFQTYDEMTFPDKKGSDLILQPELAVTVDPRTELVQGFGRKRVDADLTIDGRVTLSVRESLTGERMWLKSIGLTPETVHCEGNFYDSDAQIPASALTAAAFLNNPDCARLVGPVLERYFTSVMDASWRYLEPEEMQMVKKQSNEIKTKKVY